jgi:hypothetical protein
MLSIGAYILTVYDSGEMLRVFSGVLKQIFHLSPSSEMPQGQCWQMILQMRIVRMSDRLLRAVS